MDKYEPAVDFISKQPNERKLEKTLRKSIEYYTNIARVVRRLPQSHSEIATKYRAIRADNDLLCDMEETANLAALIRLQHTLVQACVMQSHSLVFNMVSVFREI